MIERILTNAHIITLNPAQPHARALAIGGGRILALGDDDEIRALASPGTIIENMEGRPIIPGLTEATTPTSAPAAETPGAENE